MVRFYNARFFDSFLASRLLLAASGLLAAPGCSGLLWVARGCFWLLQAAPGCCCWLLLCLLVWLLLAAALTAAVAAVVLLLWLPLWLLLRLLVPCLLLWCRLLLLQMLLQQIKIPLLFGVSRWSHFINILCNFVITRRSWHLRSSYFACNEIHIRAINLHH